MRTILAYLLLANVAQLSASKRNAPDNTLADYLAHVQMAEGAQPAHTLGSLWADSGRMASLSSDYKARNAGDLITILVVHDLTSSNTGDVSTDRSFKASSGIDNLPGRLKTTGVANLFGLHSAETLAGKGQATSTSKLRTSLAGRVITVLPSGNLVVEAERSIVMNNERQNIVLRGVVRPGDISSDNTVVSNTLGNLQLEIKGKGVISDGTRQPHSIVRLLMRIFNF
jgi:flagellar L-ring protein precursor FlgH